jgi:hypothetical protein
MTFHSNGARVAIAVAMATTATWSSETLAKLPAAVESGFNGLLLTIGVLFSLSIASMVIGAALARKLAPSSRPTRQFIVSLFTLMGIGGGAFVALWLR